MRRSKSAGSDFGGLRSQSKIAPQLSRKARGTVLCTDLQRGRDLAKRDEALRGMQGGVNPRPYSKN